MPDFLITTEDILECVDEYTLYCHYLEYDPEISVLYSSPLRQGDIHPSFNIYPSSKRPNVSFMWKDHGIQKYGDIFDLVKIMFGLENRLQAVIKIARDFGLMNSSGNYEKKIVIKEAVERAKIKISVKSRPFNRRDFDWWQSFRITEALLKQYNVTAIQHYWMTKEQITPSPLRSRGYAYRIYDRYKLYFPEEERENRFRSDLQELYMEGFQQLTFKQNLLVITKSLKDVMMLRSFGYEAVAARSESTTISPEFISFFRSKYRQILLLFDNDGKHNAHLYPDIPLRTVPISSGEKDPTDFYRRYGEQLTAEMLNRILS